MVIINNRERDLCEYLEYLDIENKITNENKLEIQLKEEKPIIDMSHMFAGCSNLLYLPDISKLNTINVINMSFMFYGCSSLLSLPALSKWNTENVTDMNNMFNGCHFLQKLSGIENWNTTNVINMTCMFKECLSLIAFPDISKWDTINVLSFFLYVLSMFIIKLFTRYFKLEY